MRQASYLDSKLICKGGGRALMSFGRRATRSRNCKVIGAHGQTAFGRTWHIYVQRKIHFTAQACQSCGNSTGFDFGS